MIASLLLRKAMFDALRASITLTTVLGGPKIYDEPPRNVTFPYLTLGETRFTDKQDDYQVATVSSRRLIGLTRRSQSLECSVVSSRSVMNQQAQALLQQIWAGRETLTLALPPSLMAITPGDVVAFTYQGQERRFVVESVTGVFAREVECRAVPSQSRSLAPVMDENPAYDMPPSYGRPHVCVLDLPTIADREGILTWIAATATPWPSSLTIWRGTEATGFVPLGQLGAAAIMGETLDALSSGPLWRWSRGSSLRVRLASGAMSSLPEERVLSGGNILAIETGKGWELLQFLKADLVAEHTYQLSGLLRGVGNSEAQQAPLIPAGANLVMLDGAIQPLVKNAASLGDRLDLRVGPSRYDHAHPAQARLQVTPTAVALRPLAPVHLRARRMAGGLALSWIRRTRTGGDAWNVLEVPLGEDQELYRLMILSSSGATIRTIETATPRYLYTTEQEMADFGVPVRQIRLSVSQLSPLVGTGFPAEATLPL